ncbi:MAG: P-loop NTPase [Deltaproteobacteria bacterium]|nr:P-loop NTPase [Deltaproteobacteria bacterium]
MKALDQAATLRARRTPDERSRLPHRVKRILAVSGGKGGVGKSSLSVNLAALYACRGERTIILDGDFAMADLNLLLGVAPSRSVLDVLQGESVDSVLVQAHGIFLLPGLNGSHQLANFDGMLRTGLRRILQELVVDFDTIVIDTAAGVDDTTMGLVASATDVILVVNAEPLSLADAYAALKILKTRHGVNRVLIAPNNVQSEQESETLLQQLRALVDRFLGIEVVNLPSVPFDGQLNAACAAGIPLVMARPDAPASRALCRMVQKIDGLTLDDIDASARGSTAKVGSPTSEAGSGGATVGAARPGSTTHVRGTPSDVAVLERPGDASGARSRPE